MKWKGFVFVPALAGLTSKCGAALVTFDFSGSSPGTHSPWNSGTVIDPHASTPGFTLGAGVIGNAGDGRFNAKGWSQGIDLESALSGNDFFGMVLSPSPGYALNLSGCTTTFTLQTSGTGPVSYAILISTDGNFSTANQMQTGSPNTASGCSLSGDYSCVTAPVELRIYGWGASGSGGTMSANSFSLEGSATPVPESSVAGAIGVLLLVCALTVHQITRQRRRSWHPAGS